MTGIISDIHGNYEALKQVLLRLDQMSVTRLICLGDVAGYYTQINECCDELRRRNALCLMGNHDWYLSAGFRCRRSRSVNDCLAYQRRVLTEENRAWIASFAHYHREKGCSFVHGGWENPIDEYVEPSEAYFSAIVEDKWFFSGHTHRQLLLSLVDGRLYCNPGSVGQPRDGDPRAAFAVVGSDGVRLYREAYDVERVGELMEARGFGSYYYDCLRRGGAHLGMET